MTEPKSPADLQAKSDARILRAETQARIETTQKVLNALVARIYDTQQKTGVWPEEKTGDGLPDDYASYFMNLQVQISAAYETCMNLYLVDDDDGNAVLIMLAQIVNDCFGLIRRLNRHARSDGVDAGKIFLNLVVGQAQAAAEQEMKIAPEPTTPPTPGVP